MYGLSSHIVSLLVQRDCVIVPGFGAFLANPISAKLNPVSHKFTPPGRQFSFNAKLNQNDGLLIHSIAQEENEAYDDAKDLVAGEVARWEQELEKNGMVLLEGLGILHKQANAGLRFEPEFNPKNALDSFGLHAFHKIPVAKEVQETATTPVEEPILERPEVSIAPVQRKTAYWKYAAAALAVPIAGYAFYLATQTTLISGTGTFALADLNPFSEKICPEYIQRKEQLSFTPSLTDDTAELAENTLLLSDDATAIGIAENKPVVKREGANKEAPYHVIAGCFGDINNAYKLVGMLNSAGYKSAKILDTNKGLHRVSSGSFSSETEADMVADELHESLAPGAWTLKK
jgi:cell division septation protein DedD